MPIEARLKSDINTVMGKTCNWKSEVKRVCIIEQADTENNVTYVFRPSGGWEI